MIIKSLNLTHALTIASLGSWLRIAQSLTFLPLDSVITRVPSSDISIKEVVVKALRGFPQFGHVAQVRKPRGFPNLSLEGKT
jgi:hypothetical protein